MPLALDVETNALRFLAVGGVERDALELTEEYRAAFASAPMAPAATPGDVAALGAALRVEIGALAAKLAETTARKSATYAQQSLVATGLAAALAGFKRQRGE